MRQTPPARRSAEDKTTAPAPESNLVTSNRWAWVGLSVFIPFAGIFIGLFLYDQDSREVRKVGRACLFIGFLVWIVFPLVVLTVLFLVGMLALATLFSQAFSGAN
jgi:hypothetical protein